MNPQPPHFIIEAGPERGRELTIPAEGARIGRATENDISIADAAMSRFQCRVYFRDGFLHVMDLGSTNETLLNDQTVTDQPLRHGDEILIGESILRVVNDGLSGSTPPPSAAPSPPKAESAAQASGEPAPAPIVFQPDVPDSEPLVSEPEEPKPAPVPVEPPKAEASPATTASPSILDDEGVDLGLGRRETQTMDAEAPAKVNVLLMTLSIMLVVMVFGVTWLFLTRQEPETTVEPPLREQPFRVIYESVRAGDGNVFRYWVQIDEDGQITAEVHDVRNQRNVNRQQGFTPESYQRLRSELLTHRDNFFRLRDTYEGIPLDVHESRDLTLIFGREVRRVRVSDQIEPDAFRAVRDEIERTINQELGFQAFHMPPEQLRAEADRAWENARKLYAERNVRHRNLWEAIQQLRQVEWLLETIEPKPAFFRDAVRLREQWTRELDELIRNLDFEAVREYQVGNRERSAALFRRILETIPDRSHPSYIQSHTRLVTIEQELNR